MSTPGSEPSPPALPQPRRGKLYLNIALGLLGLIAIGWEIRQALFLQFLWSNTEPLANARFWVRYQSDYQIGIRAMDSFLNSYFPTEVRIFNPWTFRPAEVQELPDNCYMPLSRLAPLITSFGRQDLKFKPEHYPIFSRMTRLTDLTMNGAGMTNSLWSELQRLPQLGHVEIENFGTNRESEGIEACQQLSVLILYFSKVGDPTATRLSRCPQIEYLVIFESEVTAAGVAELAKLPRLSHLDLSKSQVDDTAADSIRKMTTLETLTLRETRVGDETCKAIASLPNIRRVDLTGCPRTEVGLAALRSPPTGRQIEVTTEHSELQVMAP